MTNCMALVSYMSFSWVIPPGDELSDTRNISQAGDFAVSHSQCLKTNVTDRFFFRGLFHSIVMKSVNSGEDKKKWYIRCGSNVR